MRTRILDLLLSAEDPRTLAALTISETDKLANLLLTGYLVLQANGDAATAERFHAARIHALEAVERKREQQRASMGLAA